MGRFVPGLFYSFWLIVLLVLRGHFPTHLVDQFLFSVQNCSFDLRGRLLRHKYLLSCRRKNLLSLFALPSRMNKKTNDFLQEK